MKVNNKKGSNTRKIIPAVGMLSVSAIMLASSTYAWFTMSREVEVSNIQMTATVPEDIQISLGHLYKDKDTDATKQADASLFASTGVLHGNTSADNCGVDAPSTDWDWSNTADISAYYQIGKLIPASSQTGADIFFTPDADGVGKTVKKDAKYFKASGTTAGGTATLENANSLGGTEATELRATLHAFNAKSGATPSDTWYTATSGTHYQTATAYNTTKDDGYYVDVPIWVRTSSTAGAELSVQAYVVPLNAKQTNNTANEALYRAVRVAILDPGQTDPTSATEAQKSTVTASNLLPVADGWNVSTNGTTDGTLKDNPFSGTSILNWYNGEKTANVAVKAAGTLTGTRNDATIYGAATEYTSGATVAKLGVGTGTEYGAPAKMIVRVWLEGEDPDCWNETAGQDWSINLKFNNKTATATTKDISGTATVPAGG